MTSAYIPRALQDEIRQRAGDLCEYCRLPQSSQEATFHIDHVIPRNAGGKTTTENLALACVTCSLKKGARQYALNESDERVLIFNPRTMKWQDHFVWTVDWHLIGRTSIGQATVVALGMNRPSVVDIRKLLAEIGRMPSAD